MAQSAEEGKKILTQSEKSELLNLSNRTLDRCEKQWDNTIGNDQILMKALSEAFATRTNIPGHPFLGETHYKSDCFVAYMLDMRDSTQHLRQRISPDRAKVSQMKRVFFEVSVLLTAMGKIVSDHEGAVTEYLGDGLLALLQLPREPKDQEPILYNAMTAARTCMEALSQIVNPVLFQRYSLPPLEIGIGLAFSDAIISHFGPYPNTQVKVVGECIYFASECSKGRNEIIVHENLERLWPTSKSGRLRFIPRRLKEFNGYVVSSESA